MSWWDFLFSVAKTIKAICEIAIAAVVVRMGFEEIRRLLTEA